MTSAEPQKKKRSPLIVLLIVVGLAGACIPCTGVLAGIAVPSFIGYTRRSRTSEARVNVALIARAVARAYEDGELQPDGTLTRRLPPALASTPGVAGPEGREWPIDAAPGWSALGFVPSIVYFTYEYTPDADGRGFVVRAYGDLDGDGAQSTFEVRGTIDPSSDTVALAPLSAIDELE